MSKDNFGNITTTIDIICRFCLNLASRDAILLSNDHSILVKLRECSTIQVTLSEGLPDKVCQTCTDIVETFYAFYKDTTQKQILLARSQNTDLAIISSFKEDCDNNFQQNNKENIDIEIKSNKEYVKTTTKPQATDNKLKYDENSEDILKGALLKFGSEDEVPLSLIKKSRNIKERKKRIKSKILLNHDSTKQSKDKLFFPEGTPEHEKQWKCLMCFNIYETRTTLLNHYKSQHSSDVNYTSNYSITTTPAGIKYSCDNCNKVYDCKKKVVRHMISHVDQRPYICKLCGRTYKTACEILTHGRVHNGYKSLACSHETCGYRTVYWGALKTHEKRHKTEYKYKCEKCNKGFDVKTWYEQHQNIHSGVKPFVCDICGQAFYMERYLSTHRSTLHSDVSKAKRHICVHCGVYCDNRIAFNRHMKEHGITNTFLCDICGKSFSNAVCLKSHKQAHLGEKPHTCGTCNKAFVKKCNLKLHERTHSGEKPHACSKCGKAFSQKGSLLLHTRYHTGERPFLCIRCPKAFVSRSHLTSHQQTCS